MVRQKQSVAGYALDATFPFGTKSFASVWKKKYVNLWRMNAASRREPMANPFSCRKIDSLFGSFDCILTTIVSFSKVLAVQGI